ncbi:unnamed protein product [Rhizophagus irregularis]|nr:unnamed protein product [Rhizophagus irregularis]
MLFLLEENVYTILPALSLEGFIAVDIIEGSCDKEKFQTFVLTQLLPQINPYPAKHSVLVMDNTRIHYDDDLVTTIKDIGGRILYLPSYSPDFNPIETSFSALKSWLKRYRDLVDYFDPIYLILVALAQTTPEIAKKYFARINL